MASRIGVSRIEADADYAGVRLFLHGFRVTWWSPRRIGRYSLYVILARELLY
jgi:hypothetical protein